MTYEEALDKVTQALAPQSLSTLQIDVFQKAWNKQSYEKIARELNHEYSYIKDVGAELWKLLSQKLGIQVTKLNLHEALTRYAQQEQIHKLPVSPQSKRVDWGEAVDVSQFCGRQAQLATLEQWVIQDCCRLVAIAGMGGIGKTMLVTQLAQHLADTEQFEIVVWRSLRQAPPLIDFLRELISVLAPGQSLPIRLDATMRQLLEQLRHCRCLLVLDNVEAVLSSGELVGTYRPGYEDYGWLFQQLGEGRHQSSILLTSREIPAEVAIPSGPTAAVRLLRLEGLSIEEGETILATKGLNWTAAQPQVQELIERYQGNPLALEIVATPIKDLFDGNIAAFLAQESLLFKDIRELLAQQFNRLSSLERQVMYWLAINREVVTPAQLQAELMPSVSQVELRDALISLDRRSLIEKIKPTEAKPTKLGKLDCVGYTQQPVVMEYVTEQSIEQVCQEEQVQIVYFRSHALLKAQAKDYVRDVQIQLIVQPLTARLLEVQGDSDLKNLLLQLLRMQQLQAPLQLGYFATNAIHLLRLLGVDLSHQDFSNLTIWQADLQMVNLHEPNFSHADLSHSIFTQSISDILCVAFSPNAKHTVTSHDSGEACVWRVEDGQQTKQYLASGNEDGTVKIWDVSNSQCLLSLEGHTRQVQAIAFDLAPSQRLASGSDDCTVKVWDLQTGQCLQTLQGHTCFVVSISFHPQRKLLVSGGFDFCFKLWDLQQGTNIRTMQAYTSPIRSLTFAPEGRIACQQ